jgi:FkbM family methyltransferase
MVPTLKSYASCLLSRSPAVYRGLLRSLGRVNTEKFAYLTLLRSGQTVFDVGANTGYYTVLFSHIVGPNGRVHAFEAVPPTFAALSSRLVGERVFANVTPNAAAICDTAGQLVELTLPGDDHGQASLAAHTSGSWASSNRTSFQVESMTLDLYAETNGIRKVDFVKIDVEGAELLVLRGARSLLSRDKPTILLEFFEGWSRDFKYGAKELITLLADVGYSYFCLDDFTFLEDPVAQLANANRSVNVICSTARLR